MDIAGIERPRRLRQQGRELAANAVRPGEDTLRRPQYRDGKKIGIAFKPWPNSCAKIRRLSGAGSGLDHHDPRTRVAAHDSQFVETAQNVGVAAEEYAGIEFGKRRQPRERCGVGPVHGGPRKSVWRNAALEQIFLDAGERLRIERNLELVTAVVDGLDVTLWWRRKIDDLTVLERIEAMVVELHVAQQHDDDFFAVVLGFS